MPMLEVIYTEPDAISDEAMRRFAQRVDRAFAEVLATPQGRVQLVFVKAEAADWSDGLRSPLG